MFSEASVEFENYLDSLEPENTIEELINKYREIKLGQIIKEIETDNLNENGKIFEK